VQDASLQVASSTLAITVSPSTVSKLTITTTSLGAATVGDVYSVLVSASGGALPYRWNIASGSLPPGLSLGGSTGAISGTATTAGQFNINVQVADTSTPQQATSTSLSIGVSPSGPPPGAVVVTSLGAAGNGITDDTAAINAAIATLHAGDVLWFPCGTYAMSGGLSTISLGGVTMEGPSPTCVTLKLTGSSSFTAIKFAGGGLSANRNLAGDTTSNTFTVGAGGLATLGISAGSYAMVSDIAVASNGVGSPPISDQEVVKVTSISGDTATIENTFAHNFTLVSPFPEIQGGSPWVQKLINPLVGIAVKNISVNGANNTGASTAGLLVQLAVNSEVGFFNASNLLGTGNSSGAQIDTGYSNNFHDVICTSVGNGGSPGPDAVNIQRQTLPTVSNVTITQTSAQRIFSFSLRQVYFGSVSNITVHAGGAAGRPIKLLRTSQTSITDASEDNGAGGYNGIDVTDESTDNTFTNCFALSNDASGIVLFGNHNTNNTFTNCVSKFNRGNAFAQVSENNGTYNDFFTVVNGGTFGSERTAANIMQINSNHFSIDGATILDDNGTAANGIVVGSGVDSASITNSIFSGLPAGRDIYATGATNFTASGNTLPDGSTPSWIAGLVHDAKTLYAMLKYSLNDASR
jgi:hypothetical protein